MIQKVVYSILLTDTVDGDPSTDYYKSLKTLLNTTDLSSKIWFEKFQRLEDDWSTRENLLPCIGIGIDSDIKPFCNDLKTFICDVKIEIKAKALEESQAVCRNLAFRVRKFLESSNYTQYCNIFNKYDITSFSLTFEKFDIFINNQVSLIYKCRFHLK